MKRAWIPLLLGSGLIACGLAGDAIGPGRLEQRSEVFLTYSGVPEGSVRIDSLSWRPFLVEFGFDQDIGELEGTFSAHFANLSERELQIRYDLRFYDSQDLFIGAFIPFGQPVRLAPLQVRRVEGDFLIRADDPEDLGRVNTMHLHATVAAPE